MSDWEQIQKDFQGHQNIVVEPVEGDPPEKYHVTYYVNGIYLLPDGRVQGLGKHLVEITLHVEYPRYKPLCRIYTPIWHPNFRDGQICIGDIWGAGESLSDIIVNIGDMIQYKSWNSFSPLSADAAQWAIQNKHMFPVGNVNLWVGQGDDANKDIEIDIFDDVEKDETVEDSPEAEEPTEETPSEKVPGPVTTEENYQEAFLSTAASTSLPEVQEYTFSLGTPEDKEDVFTNDFDITAEELAGIQFVPTAQRMQNIRNDVVTNAGNKRINFKTIFFKGVLYGLIGGIAGWLISELLKLTDINKILGWMGYTYSELSSKFLNGTMTEEQVLSILRSAGRVETGLFSAVVGGTIGAIMGLGEGIYYGSRQKAAKFASIGLGVSLILGFFGGYAAQILFSYLLKDATDSTSIFTISLARSTSWALMGLGVGIAVGLIKPKLRRIINCCIGGLAGGFLGGFLFDYIYNLTGESTTDTGTLSRAVGITLLGVLIGLGIGLLEQFAKTAWLKVVRGEFEGKEYLVFAGQTSIGNSGKNTISLFKDRLVAPYHCDIVLEGNKYVLIDKGSPMGTFVNGMPINRHILRQGDAIALGNSVLIFNTK